MAIKVGEVELTQPLAPMRGTGRYERIRLLVRYRGRPLGWVSLENGHRQFDASREWIRDEIHAQLAIQLMSATLGPNLRATAPLTDLPRCSVVICSAEDRSKAPWL